MSDLEVTQDGAVLTVTFDRPEQRNAMTFAMYDGLEEACERADADDSVRVLVLRGAGGRAFVAGTDISQFREFTSGDDGIAYEERITRVVNRLEDVTVPDRRRGRGLLRRRRAGPRGGLRPAGRHRGPRASACPIARTLGNCLSMNSYSLLVAHLGPARTLDMLLRARLLSAADAARAPGSSARSCPTASSTPALDGAGRRRCSATRR